MHFQIKILALLLLQTTVVVCQAKGKPKATFPPALDNHVCRKFVPDAEIKTPRVDLNDERTSLSTKFKDCLTLKVSPLQHPNYLHISLRITNDTMITPKAISNTTTTTNANTTTPTLPPTPPPPPPIPILNPAPACINMSITQMVIQALDQDGQAVGNSNKDTAESFQIYEHSLKSNASLDLCQNEDTVATYPEADVIKKSFKCTRYQRPRGGAVNKYIVSDIKYYPTLLYIKMLKGELSYNTTNGSCFTWRVDPDEYYHAIKTKNLTAVQFLMEVFVRVRGGAAAEQTYIFIVRSPKYAFKRSRVSPPIDPRPPCHVNGNGTAIAFQNTSWKEVPGYIYLNPEAYNGCKLDYSCKLEIYIKPPQAVTNPSAILKVKSRPISDDYLKQLFLKSPAKIYFGCYSTKRCIYPERQYPGCVEMATCPHLFAFGGSEHDSYDLPDHQIVLEMYSKESEWFVVGFSADGKMGDDFAIQCLRQEKKFVKGRGYASWNYKPDNGIFKNHRLGEIVPSTGKDEDSGVRLVESIQDKDEVYCKFYVSKLYKIRFKTEEDVQVSIDLEKVFSKNICIQMAWGDTFGPNGTLSYGKTGWHSNCKEISYKDVAKRFLPNRSQRALLKVHGIIMSVVWSFCIPMLNLMASMYKQALGTKKRLGITLYAFYHIGLSLASFAMIIIAMLTCYTGKMGWTESRVEKPGQPKPHSFHRVGGYTILTMYIFNMCLGMLLKLKMFDYLKVNLFIHMLFSYGMQFWAGVLILEAPQIDYLALPCSMSIIIVVWMVVYSFYMLFLSYFPFWVPYLLHYDPLAVGKPTTRAQLIASLSKDPNHFEWLNKPDVIKIKIKFLLLLMAAAVLFTVALSVVIIEPPNGACFELESYAYFEHLEQLRLHL